MGACTTGEMEEILRLRSSLYCDMGEGGGSDSSISGE